MDIVRAEVTKRGQTFGLRLCVAVPLPAAPSLPPPGTKQLSWGWGLNTDPTTFPAGTPFAPGDARPAEFILNVNWDGSAFSAALLVTGREAVVTPIPFTISGTEVRLVVGASVLGNPSSFSWVAANLIGPARPARPLGSNSWTSLNRSTTRGRHSGGGGRIATMPGRC